MEHAEVLDALEAAFLAPGKLAALETDRSPRVVEIRAHLDACDACAAEYQAWRTAAAAMAAATPDTMRAPEEARARVLAAVAATGARRTATRGEDDLRTRRRGPVPRVPWLATAAAAGVVIFVIGAFLGGPLGLTPGTGAPSSTPALPETVAVAMDRVLAQAGHREITLVSSTGQPSGTLLVDAAGDEVVVVSTALMPAPAGSNYDCFMERNGVRTRVGLMHWDDGLAYWVGPIDEPPGAGRTGDRFVVVLDSAPTVDALVGQF